MSGPCGHSRSDKNVSYDITSQVFSRRYTGTVEVANINTFTVHVPMYWALDEGVARSHADFKKIAMLNVSVTNVPSCTMSNKDVVSYITIFPTTLLYVTKPDVPVDCEKGPSCSVEFKSRGPYELCLLTSQRTPLATSRLLQSLLGAGLVNTYTVLRVLQCRLVLQPRSG